MVHGEIHVPLSAYCVVELEMYVACPMHKEFFRQVCGFVYILADVINMIKDVIDGFYEWKNCEK